MTTTELGQARTSKTVGNYLMLKFPQKSAALSMEKALLNEIKAELQDTIDVIKNPEDITRLRGFLYHLE